MWWGTYGMCRKSWCQTLRRPVGVDLLGNFVVVGILSEEVESKGLIWTLVDSSSLVGPLCAVPRG